MGIKKVRIRIGVDGRTQFKVEGGQGADCVDFTRALEQAVGSVENRELTADYHEAATEQVRGEVKDRGL